MVDVQGVRRREEIREIYVFEMIAGGGGSGFE